MNTDSEWDSPWLNHEWTGMKDTAGRASDLYSWAFVVHLWFIGLGF